MKSLPSHRFSSILLLTLLSLLTISVIFLTRDQHRLQKQEMIHFQKQENLSYELLLSIEKSLGIFELPHPLQSLPFGEEMGIVLDVKPVHIPTIEAPYNASLAPDKEGFKMVFRYDSPREDLGKNTPFTSNIGCISLDSEFHPKKETLFTLDTKSSFSEDPRLIKQGDRYWMVYNDRKETPFWKGKPKVERKIWLAELDLIGAKLSSQVCLDRGLSPIEKNWTPFFDLQQDLRLIYQIGTQEILSQDLRLLSSSPKGPLVKGWEEKWGALRGGTPAILIDGEYLAFFHSAFKDHRQISWYVMGAYTFSKDTPFDIQKISPHPILFERIYQEPYRLTANRKARCIYPAGIAEGQKDGKDVLFISCGENDSCIKILTIDKEKLLSSMKRNRNDS